MLTRPILTGPRVRIGDLQLDPSGIARSAGELATRDLPELVRRADVPGRIETGMDVASDAIRSAVDQIPGRRRRSPWLPVLPGLAIVGLLTVLALTSWWMVRGAALSKARELDLAIDQDALDRAADDGMHVVDDTRPLATPSSPTDGIAAAVNA
jgi:hypothetical protein